MDSPLEEGTKVYINGPGQMTKIATISIYDIIILFGSQKSYDLETLHLATGTPALKNLKLYINGVTGMTLTYFPTRSNLEAYVFEWENMLRSHFEG